MLVDFLVENMIFDDTDEGLECDYCEIDENFHNDYNGFVFVKERYQTKLTKYLKSKKDRKILIK